MIRKIKHELYEFELLLKSVPSMLLTLFVLSVVSMNLLANKSIALPFDWLALDCGMLISWFTFLTMDITVKHFGSKAASELSVLAMLINLSLCGLFYLVSRVPGEWAEAYVEGSEALINSALNNTFGGTWYILFGSSLAFLLSALVNNTLNRLIGKAFYKKPDSFAAYATRSYVSTAVGQFVDNFTFSLVVSHVFFGWTLTQCVMCAAVGMAIELLCEVLFSFFGFKICGKWKREGVGREYLRYINISQNI